MAQTPYVRAIEFFISSPGDVRAERNVAEQVIHDLNRDPNYTRAYAFNSRNYQKDVAPEAGKGGPQHVIDAEIVMSQIDIVICFLWHRMGTPMTNNGISYLSGTFYEFDTAYKLKQKSKGKKKPIILIYRCTRPPPTTTAPGEIPFDPAQYELVQGFWKMFEGQHATYQALVGSYLDLDEFEKKLRRDLIQVINRNFPQPWDWKKFVRSSAFRVTAILTLLLLLGMGIYAYTHQPVKPPALAQFGTVNVSSTLTLTSQVTALALRDDRDKQYVLAASQTGSDETATGTVFQLGAANGVNANPERLLDLPHPIHKMIVDCNGNLWILQRKTYTQPPAQDTRGIVVFDPTAKSTLLLNPPLTNGWLPKFNAETISTRCEPSSQMVDVYIGYKGDYLAIGSTANPTSIEGIRHLQYPKTKIHPTTLADLTLLDPAADDIPIIVRGKNLYWVQALEYVKKNDTLWITGEVYRPATATSEAASAAVTVSIALKGAQNKTVTQTDLFSGSLAQSSQGDVWVGGTGQVFKVGNTDSIDTSHTPEGTPLDSLPMLVTPDQRWLWLSMQGCTYEPKADTPCWPLAVYLYDSKKMVRIERDITTINAILIDRPGNTWFATDSGLHQFAVR